MELTVGGRAFRPESQDIAYGRRSQSLIQTNTQVVSVMKVSSTRAGRHTRQHLRLLELGLHPVLPLESLIIDIYWVTLPPVRTGLWGRVNVRQSFRRVQSSRVDGVDHNSCPNCLLDPVPTAAI